MFGFNKERVYLYTIMLRLLLNLLLYERSMLNNNVRKKWSLIVFAICKKSEEHEPKSIFVNYLSLLEV